MDLRGQLQESLGTSYTIERELGGGGMSRVFVAVESSLGRRVVAKVLPAELSGIVSMARFRREIALAAQLQHPHIVPLLSAGEIADNCLSLPYYLMPFVDGASLREKLSRGDLPVAETISILRDVARALEYAHGKGIAHRDIKPDNVLLAGTSAVVTDFGVAKALSDASTAGPLTSMGVALGTAAYMAPEQAAADPSSDERADIYSFGVMAYEMLAGHLPFAGRNAQATMAAHATETPANISALRPATPPALADLVMRCLEKRPGDRPQNVSEIVQQLQTIVVPVGTSSSKPRGAATVTPNPRNRLALFLAVPASVFLAMFASALWEKSHNSAAVGNDIRSIAVMPLQVGKDTSIAYLEDGVTDHVRDALNAIPSLKVKARSSSLLLMGKDVDEIGKRLGVDAVLQGTVSEVKSQLHVTVEVVRTSDGSRAWSNSFDTGTQNLAILQDSITAGVMRMLRTADETAPAQNDVRSARGTANDTAYNFFIRGQHALDRFEVQRAEEMFKAAIARDPKFARAYAFLSMTYTELPILGIAPLDSSLALAQINARTALGLDSNVVEAHVSESFLLSANMRVADAIKPLIRALQLDSTNSDVLSSYAIALAQVGKVDEALIQGKRARDRDPLSASAVGVLGYIFGAAGQYDSAMVQVREASNLDPQNPLPNRELGFFNVFAGRPDSALQYFEKGFKLNPATFGGRSNLVFGYAVAGNEAEAVRQRALLQKEIGGNSRNYYDVLTNLAFGDFNAAMNALERGVADRDPLFSNMSIPCDALFDPLKSNPRFTALMLRIGATACPSKGNWGRLSPKPAR